MFVPLYSEEAAVGYGQTCKTSTVKLFRLPDATGQFIISLEAISINFSYSFSYFPATYMKCVNNNEMILGTHMHTLINLILNMSGAPTTHYEITIILVAANLADRQLINTFFH